MMLVAYDVYLVFVLSVWAFSRNSEISTGEQGGEEMKKQLKPENGELV